jgi:hypothetical protein
MGAVRIPSPSAEVQRSNRMDITELLNPAVESHNLFDATDKDIFDSVMGAKMVSEGNARGKDNDTDIDVPEAMAGPTRRELLEAALMLRKHAATLNEPFACKLEVMLGLFGQWTCAVEMQDLRDTKKTDFFARKWTW